MELAYKILKSQVTAILVWIIGCGVGVALYSFETLEYLAFAILVFFTFIVCVQLPVVMVMKNRKDKEGNPCGKV